MRRKRNRENPKHLPISHLKNLSHKPQLFVSINTSLCTQRTSPCLDLLAAAGMSRVSGLAPAPQWCSQGRDEIWGASPYSHWKGLVHHILVGFKALRYSSDGNYGVLFFAFCDWSLKTDSQYYLSFMKTGFLIGDRRVSVGFCIYRVGQANLALCGPVCDQAVGSGL